MKRYNSIINLKAILAILLIAIFIQNFGQEKKIQVKLLTEIGHSGDDIRSDNPYLFFRIGSVTCDSDGKIYVLDEKDVSVKIYDRLGKFVGKLFREGRGPEQIEVPYDIKINRFSNHLFVLDMHGFELKEFDLTGKYVNVFHLPHQIMLFFDFLDKDRLIFVNTKTDERIRILNLSSMKFEKSLARVEPVPSIVFVLQKFVIKDGILWTCFDDKTELVGYDFNNGKEVARIPIPEKYEKYVIDKGTNWWAARLRQFAQPIVLNDGIYVLFSRWEWTSDKPAKEKDLNLSLYRLSGGKLLKITDLPEARFMRLGTTWQNRLILYGNDPYPNIKIFEVSE